MSPSTKSAENPFPTLPLVVVGGGAVGLVAALAARRQGLPVVVIEAEPEDRVRPGSRATYLFKETLDLLEVVAPTVPASLVELSGPWNVISSTWAGKEVYRREFPPSVPGAFGVSVSQKDQEQVYLKCCHDEGVLFRWGAGVEKATTDSEGVDLSLTDGTSIRASYVIGADGARSAVRSSLGITLDGTRSSSYFVIVDVADNESDLVNRERTFHYRHPAVGGRNVLVVPFGGGWRLDLECFPGEDVTQWQNEPELSRWIAAVGDPSFPERVQWVSTYRFNRSVATSYTDPNARVLLAGEACHLFPPFGGGRGLNSGIADAIFSVEAIAAALAHPEDATRIIRDVANERRQAGLKNRDAASNALARMEAATPWRKVQQRVAAVLAPRSDRIGRWFDRGPMGPSEPVSPRSRF